MELKAHITELSEKIIAGATVEKTGNEATAKFADDVYAANLPEGLDIDTVKAVEDYNITFVAGATHAFGQVAVKALKEDKKLDRVTGEVTVMTKANLALTTKRVTEHRNPQKPEETITSYGQTRAVLKTTADKGDAGQLSAALADIKKAAAEAFGKK